MKPFARQGAYLAAGFFFAALTIGCGSTVNLQNALHNSDEHSASETFQYRVLDTPVMGAGGYLWADFLVSDGNVLGPSLLEHSTNRTPVAKPPKPGATWYRIRAPVVNGSPLFPTETQRSAGRAYDWGKVLSFFQSGPPPNAPNPTPPPQSPDEYARLSQTQQAIHVFAFVGPKKIRILTSFSDYGSPFHETRSGPAQVEGLDEAGNIVFRVPAYLNKIYREDDTGVAIVSIALSDRDVTRLQQIRITYDGFSYTRHASPPAPAQATAVAVDAKHARITFDGTHFPTMIVRQAKSPDTFPLYSDGTATSSTVIETSEPDVYCDFSDGVKTVAFRVKVHVRGR